MEWWQESCLEDVFVGGFSGQEQVQEVEARVLIPRLNLIFIFICPLLSTTLRSVLEAQPELGTHRSPTRNLQIESVLAPFKVQVFADCKGALKRTANLAKKYRRREIHS